MAKTFKMKKPTLEKVVTEKNRRYGIFIVLLLLGLPGLIYGGLPFLVAYAATAGMYALCSWLMPPIAKPMFVSFAFHMGLIAFRLVGQITLWIQGEFIWMLWVELLAALLMLVWLMWKPNMWPASLLMIFDALIFLNTFGADVTADTLPWPVAVIRLAWPLVASIGMFVGMHKIGIFTVPLPYNRRRKIDVSDMVLRAPKRMQGSTANASPRQDPISKKRAKRRK